MYIGNEKIVIIREMVVLNISEMMIGRYVDFDFIYFS